MPVNRGVDSKGPFYRWGSVNKKYYYEAGNKKSREMAYDKTMKQARAILWSQSQYRK
jgi:hypothetical protein